MMNFVLDLLIFEFVLLLFGFM